MDNSNEFRLMLDKVIESEPVAFKNFDRTKNVQDQLQEMLLELDRYKNSPEPWFLLTSDIHYFSNFMESEFFGFDGWDMGRKCNYISQFKSMEQLWLAFVMHERYHKKWLGGEWTINDK